jgi:hypothetical protein
MVLEETNIEREGHPQAKSSASSWRRCCQVGFGIGGFDEGWRALLHVDNNSIFVFVLWKAE